MGDDDVPLEGTGLNAVGPFEVCVKDGILLPNVEGAHYEV